MSSGSARFAITVSSVSAAGLERLGAAGGSGSDARFFPAPFGRSALELTSRAALKFHLEACTNLIDWIPVADLNNAEGVIQFVDPDTLNFLSGDSSVRRGATETVFGAH